MGTETMTGSLYEPAGVFSVANWPDVSKIEMRVWIYYYSDGWPVKAIALDWFDVSNGDLSYALNHEGGYQDSTYLSLSAMCQAHPPDDAPGSVLGWYTSLRITYSWPTWSFPDVGACSFPAIFTQEEVGWAIHVGVILPADAPPYYTIVTPPGLPSHNRVIHGRFCTFSGHVYANGQLAKNYYCVIDRGVLFYGDTWIPFYTDLAGAYKKLVYTYGGIQWLKAAVGNRSPLQNLLHATANWNHQFYGSDGAYVYATNVGPGTSYPAKNYVWDIAVTGFDPAPLILSDSISHFRAFTGRPHVFYVKGADGNLWERIYDTET